MRLTVDLPDDVDVEESREFLTVDGQRFSKRDFRCYECYSTTITADYHDRHTEKGVVAVVVGTSCDRCGDSQVHIGY